MLKNDLRGDLIAMVTITITYMHLLWVHMSGHNYTCIPSYSHSPHLLAPAAIIPRDNH
jgi:hypothetical protein